MAFRRSQKKTARSSGAKAPWRSTRLVDMALGGLCNPGFDPVCDNPQVNGAWFVFPSATDPCATIAIVPILEEEDFQAPPRRWKERIVATGFTVDMLLAPSYLWLVSADTQSYRMLIVNQMPTGVFIQPWRSACVIYDRDEVDSVGVPSLYGDGWTEDERMIPGTFRQGALEFYGAGSSDTRKEHAVTKSRMRRRLETGEGLYYQLELGCATFSGDFPWGTPITQAQAIAAFQGPMWVQGKIVANYLE